MKTTDEYRQRLVAELIEQSAKIDTLVIKSRQATADIKLNLDQELEALRAKHQITTTNCTNWKTLTAVLGEHW